MWPVRKKKQEMNKLNVNILDVCETMWAYFLNDIHKIIYAGREKMIEK